MHVHNCVQRYMYESQRLGVGILSVSTYCLETKSCLEPFFQLDWQLARPRDAPVSTAPLCLPCWSCTCMGPYLAFYIVTVGNDAQVLMSVL